MQNKAILKYYIRRVKVLYSLFSKVIWAYWRREEVRLKKQTWVKLLIFINVLISGKSVWDWAAFQQFLAAIFHTLAHQQWCHYATNPNWIFPNNDGHGRWSQLQNKGTFGLQPSVIWFSKNSSEAMGFNYWGFTQQFFWIWSRHFT